MKWWIAIVVILMSELSFAQNQQTNDFAMSQDSTLYSEIETRVQKFPSNTETRDVSISFSKHYQKITGNTDVWMFESKCDDGITTCSYVYRIRDNQILCTLKYKIPINKYERNKILKSRSIKKGNCIDHIKDQLDQIEWVRDYPLFIQNLNIKDKNVIEEEKYWWVARYKNNPYQIEVNQQIEEFKKYYFVFISGITAEEQTRDYMNPHFVQLEGWMRQHGISSQFLVTLYNRTPNENFEVIADAIRTLFSKKIIFITHSKGGLDLANYLLKVPQSWNSELSPVKGWITFQTPFWGTKNAQDCLADPIISSAIDYYEWDEDMSDEITESISPKWAFETWCNSDKSPKPEVEALLSSSFLKILNIKTWTERFETFASQDAGMETLKSLGFDLKGPTDTYIWLPCTNIPGVDYVAFQGFHHWDLSKPRNKKFDEDHYYHPVAFLRASLIQLLSFN